MVAVEHGDDDRSRLRRSGDDRAVDRPQRREQAGDADREARRRHRLGAEACDQSVVAPAAADRTEANRPPLVVLGFEGQLGLENRAGVIFEAAHHGRIEDDAVLAIADGARQRGDLAQLGHPLLADRRARDGGGERGQRGGVVQPARGGIGEHAFDRRRLEPRALGEVAAVIPAAGAEQRLHPVRPEPVELIDRAQHGEPARGVVAAAEADRFHHAVEHLAIVDFDQVVATPDAQRLEAIGGHHAHLGVGGRGRRPDGVGVELHELAVAPRSGLLIAEHPTGAIAAIGLGQALVMLGDIAGERRGQVIAQAQPLLVVVLEREHALVGPILVGQELAKRLGKLDERRFDRLEAVKLVDRADLGHHRLGPGDVGGSAIDEAARQDGADARADFVGHVRSRKALTPPKSTPRRC